MRRSENAPVLLFSSGVTRFAVFVAEVAKIVNDAAIAPVPFAHPALVGLLDVVGHDSVPVFDLVASTADPGRVDVALFETEEGPVGIRLDDIFGARAAYEIVVDAETIAALAAELPERLSSTITTAGRVEGHSFLFFSPDAFLARLDLARASRPDAPAGVSVSI